MRTDSRIIPLHDEMRVTAPQEDVLRELERHGYVAEPVSAAVPGGTLCRHPAAPNLVVRDDGRIELLIGQPNTENFLPWQPPVKRIYRGRTLLVLALLCASIFLGLIVVAMIVG